MVKPFQEQTLFSITPDEILKMGHLENIEVLKQKIIEKLNNDEKLVKMVYKLLF